MTALFPLSHLQAFVLSPASLAAMTAVIAAASIALSGKPMREQAGLFMDAVNPERPPRPDLPTPHDVNSIRELDLLLRRLSAPENQVVVYRRFAQRAGIELSAQEMWLLLRLAEIVGATEADLAQAFRIEPHRLNGPLATLQTKMLVSTGDDSLCLTDEGRAMLAKMEQARQESLAELLSEWAPGGHYEIQRMLVRFKRTLNAQMPPDEPVA